MHKHAWARAQACMSRQTGMHPPASFFPASSILVLMRWCVLVVGPVVALPLRGTVASCLAVLCLSSPLLSSPSASGADNSRPRRTTYALVKQVSEKRTRAGTTRRPGRALLSQRCASAESASKPCRCTRPLSTLMCIFMRATRVSAVTCLVRSPRSSLPPSSAVVGPLLCCCSLLCLPLWRRSL